MFFFFDLKIVLYNIQIIDLTGFISTVILIALIEIIHVKFFLTWNQP